MSGGRKPECSSKTSRVSHPLLPRPRSSSSPVSLASRDATPTGAERDTHTHATHAAPPWPARLTYMFSPTTPSASSALAGRGRGRGNWAASAGCRLNASRYIFNSPNPHHPPQAHASKFAHSPTLRRDRSRLPPQATPPPSPSPRPAGAMGSTGSEAEVSRADFPDRFIFGVATSAYQVPPPPRPARPHTPSAISSARPPSLPRGS